jgi:glycosyltransferase involved in cell wall biosynthesis
MNRSNYLVACSMDNYKYILCKYPHVKTKLVIDLLGTEIPNTVAKQSEDGILRIVSCAFMVSYKRIELLIESLEHINIPIHWTHIGDGPMRKSYEDKMLKLTAVNSKVKYQFTGAIPHNQLISYYISRPIDLFVNTSITEGIPISIMEILSLQVPVVATNVGGVNEIVISDYNGYLVDSMITPFELAQVITKYSNLSKSKKQELSNNARKIVIDKFDCYKCAEDLAQNVFIN